MIGSLNDCSALLEIPFPWTSFSWQETHLWGLIQPLADAVLYKKYTEGHLWHLQTEVSIWWCIVQVVRGLVPTRERFQVQTTKGNCPQFVLSLLEKFTCRIWCCAMYRCHVRLERRGHRTRGCVAWLAGTVIWGRDELAAGAVGQMGHDNGLNHR